MSDLFHPAVPEEFIWDVFEVMADTARHTYQVLTKRPQRAAALVAKLPWPENVWLGTSVEAVLMVILGGANAFFGPLAGAVAVLSARSFVVGRSPVAVGQLFEGEIDRITLKRRELLRRLDLVGLDLGYAADALADGRLKRGG
jgi:hypothetical protein